MSKCRECRPHIHEAMYWWCRLDEPVNFEEEIGSQLHALVVSTGMPFAYVRESLDKKGKKCKPHWHFWIYGYRCELRDWCRQYASAGGYMVKLADTQQADCAQGIVNYVAKSGATYTYDGISDDVVENGLKIMESYKKERISVYRQLDILVKPQAGPAEVIDTVLDFFRDRDMYSSYSTWKTYIELFILKRSGVRARMLMKERLIRDIGLSNQFRHSEIYTL